MTIGEFIAGYRYKHRLLRLVILTHDYDTLANLKLDFSDPNSEDMKELDNTFADAFVNSWYISNYGKLVVFVG